MPRNPFGWLGVREAAGMYRISKDTILAAIHAGAIPAYKPGGRRLIFKQEDIDAWIMTKPA